MKRAIPRKLDQSTMLLAVVPVALIASVAGLNLITENATLTVAYLGGLIVLAATGFAALHFTRKKPGQAIATPDWSVTVAAIEQDGLAIAITDRANRLVCANNAYNAWFGHACAPPGLPLDHASMERLMRAARDAWREGNADCENIAAPGGKHGWDVSVHRAGRGEDYLIWRIHTLEDRMSDSVEAMTGGALGTYFSQAGVELALVTPDGHLRAVSSGFAQRAAGDGAATLAGQPLVSFLRNDESERIFFTREGRKGSAQTLVQIPLDVALTATPDGAATGGNSLVLLIDSGIGIGGAAETGAGNATPQLEALLGALPLGLAMTDRDGRFLFGNEAFQRAVGCEGKGMPQYPSDLVVHEDKAALADTVRRFGKGPASSGNMAVRARALPDSPVSLGLAGIRGLGEAAVLLSLVDSTEETRLKRQVAQATKMQAVGQLAGGVAHDFNNVLTAIIGYCDLMLLRHTPGDSDYDDIQQIRANSNRAASLTRQLLAFSRQQTLRPVVLQVPDVVSEVSQLLKRLLGENITLSVRHDRDLGPVRADPQQLEQVIINLAVNARDAINQNGRGRGKLTLATRRVAARDIRAMGADVIPEADYTALVVQDTGGGIPPDILGKIFEPFFTTKEQGKGTGLGLSTVYGIIKQSGGFVFVDNIDAAGERPAGTRFTIYLPVYSGSEAIPLAEEPEPDASASEWSEGGRLLLVEDEDMVRAVAERALSRAGYEVMTAADGEEGLAAIANHGPFDMVVSDVVMPGMDGPTMVKAIRKQHPDLPVLFMSGYAEEQLRAEINVDQMHFIPKPFSVQQISDKVGMVMQAARGHAAKNAAENAAKNGKTSKKP